MGRLEIKLLGPFQVSLDDVTLSGFDSDKVRALLAYLAVEADQPHRRERLAGLLWPDWPERSARTNLRSALANLRKVIGDHDAQPPFLLITRQTIQFNPASDSWLDVARLRALSANRSSGAADIDQLEEAIDLYKGNFLEGFSIPDSIPFEEWSLMMRQSLQGQALRALHHLAGYYQQTGAYEQALGFARQQIEMDAYQESAHQQVMWIQAQSGRRNEALRHYEGFRDLLEEELGVEPLESTQQMYMQLLKDDLPGPPTATVVVRREPRAVGECPYLGLAAFSEADAAFFFGREDFTEQLAEMTENRSPVTVIVGSSGSGKSSTVFAGLMPRLRREGHWQLMNFRPRGRPFQSLAAALLPYLDGDLSTTDQLIETQKLAGALQDGEISLSPLIDQIMDRFPDQERLLMVVDQFEELYTLCPDSEERRNFIQVLLETLETDRAKRIKPCVLLLTLRADFMGQALAYRTFADALQEGTLILGPMNRNELRDVVEKPAVQQGAAFETGLIGRILDDVGEEPGNLPLLEFALTMLWERLDQGWMTHSAYAEIGRVAGALAGYAEQVYNHFDDEDRERAQRVFVQLVQPGVGTEDTRRIALKSELGEVNWGLVQHLADRRLVVTSLDEDGQEVVEVVHEALIRSWERLRVWMDTDRYFRTWQESLRSAMRQWEANQRDEGVLLRGAPLVQAEAWLAERQDELSEMEQEFISSSLGLREREYQRRERRRRRTVAGLAIGLVITVLLSMAAIWQWQRAELQARLSRARELAAAANTNLEVDPELSILLALQAVDETYQVDRRFQKEAQEALHQAVQAMRLQMTIKPDEEQMYTVAYSPDGTRLITWGMTEFPGTTQIWNSTTSEELFSMPGEIALQVLPGSEQLVTVYPDFQQFEEKYTAWDIPSAQPLSTIGVPFPEASPLRNSFNADSTMLARALDNGETEIWDLKSGNILYRLGQQGRLPDFDVAFSPDGKLIATGNADGSATIWSLENGADLLTLSGHHGQVNRIAFNPDSQLLATASGDGSVKLWELESGLELATLHGHSNEILALAISQDGSLLATGSFDRTIKIWDLNASITTGQGQEILTLAGHSARIEEISFSPDGKRLASASPDGTVKVWDIHSPSGTEGSVFANGPGATQEWLVTIDLSPDGTRLLTTNADFTPRVWDTHSAELLLTLNGHTDVVERAEFSPDGAYIVSAGHDNLIKGWDAAIGDAMFSLEGYNCAGRGFSCDLAFSPDGKQIATVDSDGMLMIFDVPGLLGRTQDARDTAMLSVPAHEEFIFDVVYSPDGEQIVTTSEDTTARVWDADSGELLHTITGHEDFVLGASYSPDGETIVTTSSDGTAQMWDASTFEWKLTMSGHSGSVFTAAFNPDGDQIATASYDGTVKLWDAGTGAELLNISSPSGVGGAVFSPDGRRLYTAQVDGFDRVYLLDTEELLALARQRLTRTFTDDECRRYLHLEECPPLP